MLKEKRNNNKKRNNIFCGLLNCQKNLLDQKKAQDKSQKKGKGMEINAHRRH